MKKDATPEVEIRSIEVSTESRDLLVNYIKRAYSIILKTKKPTGLDGVTYYFMIPDSKKSTMLRAETWSPKTESEPYRIIQQAEGIINYISDPKRNEKNLKKLLKDQMK